MSLFILIFNNKVLGVPPKTLVGKIKKIYWMSYTIDGKRRYNMNFVVEGVHNEHHQGTHYFFLSDSGIVKRNSYLVPANKKFFLTLNDLSKFTPLLNIVYCAYKKAGSFVVKYNVETGLVLSIYIERAVIWGPQSYQ